MRMAILLAGLAALPAFAATQAANPFFALCHDTHDAKKRSLTEQAALLKELGYDGCAHLWLGGLPERLKTLDEAGLKLYQVYVRVNVAPGKQGYEPQLKDAVKLLQGRPTGLGLLVSGGPASSEQCDERAVEVIREIGALAQASGIRVALYPHVGDYVQRVADAVRIVRKVDRPNVGVQFNLCHFLKVEDEKGLEATLKLALPHLFVVTVNGADAGARGAGWDRLIQPLGSGSFDMLAFLRMLKGLGYAGPIGLQCYGLGGDARDHLARSIEAWRELSSKPAEE